MKISLSRQNNHWLSQTRSSLLKFIVLSTANGVLFCEICLQSAAHIRTTIQDLFILFLLKKPILDPRSPIQISSKPRSFFLIKIVLFFDHLSNHSFQSNQHFQAIEFVDRPREGGGSSL